MKQVVTAVVALIWVLDTVHVARSLPSVYRRNREEFGLLGSIAGTIVTGLGTWVLITAVLGVALLWLW